MKSCVKDKEGLSIAVNFSAIFLLNATIRLDIVVETGDLGRNRCLLNPYSHWQLSCMSPAGFELLSMPMMVVFPLILSIQYRYMYEY